MTSTSQRETLRLNAAKRAEEAGLSPSRAPQPIPHLDAVLLLAVLVVGDSEAQGVSGAFDQHEGGALWQRERAVKHGGRAATDLGAQPLETIQEQGG